MDAKKQRLVELLGVITCPNTICNSCEHFRNTSACEQHKKEVIADHLIANGVMFQTDCEACGKATIEVITGLQEMIAKLRKAQEQFPSSEPPNETPSFTAQSIHCEDLVFAIETDAWGRRKVHFFGYGYFAGDESEAYPYRFVEYTFFYAPLDDAVKYGIFHLEEKGAEFVKQDIEDCSYEQMIAIYQGYDNGKCPALITEAAFTADLPDGMYIIQHPTNAQ